MNRTEITLTFIHGDSLIKLLQRPEDALKANKIEALKTEVRSEEMPERS